MKTILRTIVSIFMVAVLVSSSLTAFAESGDSANTANINIADVNIKSHVNIDYSRPAIKLKANKVTKAAKAVSGVSAFLTSNVVSPTVFLQNNPRLIQNGILTAENNTNYIYFTVTKDTFIWAKLASSNSDYTISLYKIDDTTGQALPTDIVENSNSIIANSGLEQGDYLFLISSNGSVGDNYDLQINATNPAGEFSSINTITPSLQQLVISYTNQEVYANGIYVFSWDSAASNRHLNWRRDVMAVKELVTETKKMILENVKVRTISAPVTYTSQYASSDNAILLYLNEGTAYTYYETITENANPLNYSKSFVDPNGKITPRNLDSSDFVNATHILVLDLNTGKPIDFFSSLNYFYNDKSVDREDSPKITYNQ
ncbi:hypothetical protein [Ruminiclostridium cellulolyticum]|uniref:Uncharacterized protein n=1 Tax=Ruminiclostridium cellulolyticum (strain ATCC 35319 / DSM 5812 / JCM 6584 / H10) TaxID=394503 RepID=B8I5X0_RUMCH|nr:hypothetical protein [Ruminiclostridium cellulolyticum]ACL74787.1 hypothetical protein Ccel_0402 [Ruminiclostridium cellulolyticum H10]